MWGGGSGGKDVTILNQLNIEYHAEIVDCYTGLGVTGDGWGSGGKDVELVQYCNVLPPTPPHLPSPPDLCNNQLFLRDIQY